MRLLSCLFPLLCIGLVSATSTLAQNKDERQSEEQYEPYHKHYDKHHGHNHAYPDRGAIFREAPRGAIAVNYAGVSYRYADGVWFEPRGPAFIVVAPPIGLVVSSLPAFATRVDRGGESYLYTNEIFYRARPDLGGYEVVNDPEDGAVPAAASAAAAATPAASDSTAAPLTATLAATTAGNALPATAAQVSPPTAIPVAAGPVAQSPAALPITTTPPVTTAQAATAAQPIASAQPVTAAQIAPPAASLPIPPPVPVQTALPAAAAPLAVPAVLPATSSQAPSSGQTRGVKVIAYPKNGQTPEVQARDHYECYRFAVAQSGFDPMHSGGAAAVGSTAEPGDYERAQAACFEGRGYTIR